MPKSSWTTKCWALEETGEVLFVSVEPIDDEYSHDSNYFCPCKPKVETYINKISGREVEMLIHNSFDGREALEEAKAILRIKTGE